MLRFGRFLQELIELIAAVPIESYCEYSAISAVAYAEKQGKFLSRKIESTIISLYVHMHDGTRSS